MKQWLPFIHQFREICFAQVGGRIYSGNSKRTSTEANKDLTEDMTKDETKSYRKS